MLSYTQRSFWNAYSGLPENIRRQAREAFRLFQDDPYHPSLQFKRVGKRSAVYSARVTADYRAMGVKDGDEIVWFWIGSHSEYDHLLRRT